jgi:type IV pilus assembly protein PilV
VLVRFPPPRAASVAVLPKRRVCAPRRAMGGVSLIEVMIALLLLSFGLMGMLGLKLTGLKMTGHAQSRAVAAMHAAEILDRMRANPVRAAAGEYDLAMAAAAPAAPAGIAQTDLVEWRRGITQNLPAGSGSVLALPNGTVRVVVRWNERGDESGDARDVAFTFEARL